LAHSLYCACSTCCGFCGWADAQSHPPPLHRHCSCLRAGFMPRCPPACLCMPVRRHIHAIHCSLEILSRMPSKGVPPLADLISIQVYVRPNGSTTPRMSAALWPLRSPLVCYHFASDIVRSWWFVRGLARIGTERGFLLCVGASVRAHIGNNSACECIPLSYYYHPACPE